MSSVYDMDHVTLPEPESEPVRRLYLYPGQIVTSGEPLLVTTILGSCIAICMWDAVAMIGGINHFLLPVNPLTGQSDLRYGNTATDRLVAEMLALGVKKSRIVAKVIGGAAVLASFAGARQSIGDQNIAAARHELGRHGIPISAEQTGGTRGRKLLFHTGNGSLFVKEIGQ